MQLFFYPKDYFHEHEAIYNSTVTESNRLMFSSLLKVLYEFPFSESVVLNLNPAFLGFGMMGGGGGGDPTPLRKQC